LKSIIIAIQLSTTWKYYLITGDVVAYYPSIPIEKCINITGAFYMDHYHNGVTPTEHIELQEAHIFVRCLNIGNQELILRYKDRMYLQKCGLAMGITDSPDLANLVGWHFKKKCNILDNLLIPFYGRYINDVFAIVYTNSEEEALAHIETVKFDDCHIE